jgi:hypothetical protein
VRQTESKVRAEGRGQAAKGGKEKRDPDTIAAEEKMARALGTPVRIRGRERGRIEIRFATLNELERLYELLTSSKTRSGK